MVVTHQVADNDPARAVAKMSEMLLRQAKRSDVDSKMKYQALVLLELCAHPDGAVPPPRELIALIRYLLLPGRETDGPRWKSTEFPNEPLVEIQNRLNGYSLGFSNPQPRTVEKITTLLIPFECLHPADPSGYWPSTASEGDVARHVDDSVKNVRRWRKMPKVMALVADWRSQKTS